MEHSGTADRMPLTIKVAYGDSIRRLKLQESTIECLQELITSYYGTGLHISVFSSGIVLENTADLLDAVSKCPSGQVLKLEIHSSKNPPKVTIHTQTTAIPEAKTEAKAASIPEAKASQAEAEPVIQAPKSSKALKKPIHWKSHPMQGLRSGLYTREMYQQRHMEMFGPSVPLPPVTVPSYDLVRPKACNSPLGCQICEHGFDWYMEPPL